MGRTKPRTISKEAIYHGILARTSSRYQAFEKLLCKPSDCNRLVHSAHGTPSLCMYIVCTQCNLVLIKKHYYYYYMRSMLIKLWVWKFWSPISMYTILISMLYTYLIMNIKINVCFDRIIKVDRICIWILSCKYNHFFDMVCSCNILVDINYFESLNYKYVHNVIINVLHSNKHFFKAIGICV